MKETGTTRAAFFATLVVFVCCLFFVSPSSAFATTAIYRSASPAATSALAVGTSNSLTISGSTATFASALPSNVGVGDALQYDSDGNGSIDSIAFIHGRTSSTVYTVKSASGATPTAVSGDNDWSLFRAYTSLGNAESGTENASIDSAVQNFDTFSGGNNLVTGDLQWNILLYANGTTGDSSLTIDGWTASATQYLNIYTPTSTAEVGTSQRHAGVWDDTKYKLDGTTSPALTIADQYVRVSGLQIDGASTTASQTVVSFSGSGGNTESRFFQNIVKKPAGGSSNVGVSIAPSGLNFYIYDNLIYDIAGTSGIGIYDTSGSGSFVYAYNNTIANASSTGALGVRTGTTSRMMLKNNLFTNDNIAATGTMAAGSDYNATNNATMGAGYTVTGAGNTHDRTSQTFTFTGAASKNFHLSSSDLGALDFGATLSADSNLPFNFDMDGNIRSGTWDIGAFEFIPPDVLPPGRLNGSPSGTLSYGTTQTAVSLTTDENATCKYATTTGVAYASMANTFTTTGNLSQSVTITGLSNGQSYAYYVRCQDTTGNSNTDDFTISFSIAATDTVPPTVSLTAPANNSYASSTSVTLSASASDTGGLEGVQFKLDGVTNIGSEDTSAPYSVSWNPLTTTEGAHTILAVAKDNAGNYATSTAVNVTVDYTTATLSLTSPVTGTTVHGIEVISYTGSATTSPQCSVDQVRWTSCGNGETYLPQIAGYALVTPGATFTLYMRDSDSAGNSTSTSVANLTKAVWTAPIGIPAPSFGITQTVASVYGDPDYYTYWIDNSAANATDTANASGTPAVPRKTIPSTLTLGPGDVVQVRGGTYTVSQDRFVIIGHGTVSQPIFVTGIRASSTPVLQKWVHFQDDQYVVLEGFKIHSTSDSSSFANSVTFRPSSGSVTVHHDAVRYVEAAGYATSSTSTTGPAQFSADTNNKSWPDIHDVVFFNNVSHDSGNYHDATQGDQHSFPVGWNVSNEWILDNVAFRSSGDGVQIGSQANFLTDHIYVGRNLFYAHKENGFDLKEANDIVVSQNVMHTFLNTPSGGSFAVAAVIHYDPSRVWFIGNDISDTEVGINSTGASNMYIVGNVLHDIARYPTTVETHASTSPHRIGSAIYWYSTGPITVANNTIYNTGAGISADMGDHGATIENNLISTINLANNDYHMVLYGTTLGISLTTLRNNLMYQPGKAVATYLGSPLVCTNCVVDQDPLLTNPSSSNLTLQSNSPARESGVNPAYPGVFQGLYGLDISIDIASTLRPQGSTWDIGAYESAGTAVTPTVSTNAASSVAQTTALLNGSITSTGGANATQAGFAYGTDSTLTTVIATSTDGAQTGLSSFNHPATGLTCNTQYYFRAYAVNSAGTSTGSILPFTTQPCNPTLITSTFSSITQTTALASSTVTNTGGGTITVRGFTYGTGSTYTATTTESGSFGTGGFSSTTSSLACNTLYNVRSYATNVGGTGYGTNATFTTSACSGPNSVATNAATSITQTSFVANGAITSTGGADASESGFAFGTDPTLSTGASTSTLGAQTGLASFNNPYSALSCATTYYYRAYAVNTSGTSTGSIVQVDTVPCAPTLSIQAVSSIGAGIATANGTITATGGSNATVRGFVYGTDTTYGATTTESGSFGTGAFATNLDSLACGTTYYLNVYATNAGGTSYGSGTTFSTTACSAPTVTTESVQNIDKTIAYPYGSISDTGGSDSIEAGFEYSTDPLLATNISVSSVGPFIGTGTFYDYLSSFSCGTDYYIRAYATNNTGTGKGSILHFTTLACDVSSYSYSSSTSDVSYSGYPHSSGRSYSAAVNAAVNAVGTPYPVAGYPRLVPSLSAFLQRLVSFGIITQDKADAARAIVSAADRVSLSLIPRAGIQLHDSGEGVRSLQTILAAKGYLQTPPNGVFGLQTLSALKAYQRDHGVPATGFYGMLTKAALGVRE